MKCEICGLRPAEHSINAPVHLAKPGRKGTMFVTELRPMQVCGKCFADIVRKSIEARTAERKNDY